MGKLVCKLEIRVSEGHIHKNAKKTGAQIFCNANFNQVGTINIQNHCIK